MDKIFIWGTGNTAKNVMKNGIIGRITGYVETLPSKTEIEGKKIICYKELAGDEIVVVATIYVDEVYECLQKEGINIDNFIFYCKCKKVNYRSNLYLAKKVLSLKNLQIYLNNYSAFKYSFFSEDMKRYQNLNRRENFAITDKNIRPIITDKYDEMGTVDDSFWESVWVASRIRENMPKEHYDIGSRLNGFLSIIISMGIPLKVIDVRPFPIEIEGMENIIDDATELKEFADNSIESLSAVSSLEHFGLGRYGDTVNPEACFECFKNIQKKLKKGGKFYMTVPIGRERCCFNAHRVFNPLTIINEFEKLSLVEFSYIFNGNIYRNVDLYQFENFRDDIICDGLFLFEKE